MVANIGIVCGIALGLFGSVLSVVQLFYQREKDREQAAREKEEAEKQAAREKERDAREKERDEKQDRKDRLEFLKDMIIDQDISIEGRRPFYEEYLKLGGNGAVIRFWNHEVEGRTRGAKTRAGQ